MLNCVDNRGIDLFGDSAQVIHLERAIKQKPQLSKNKWLLSLLSKEEAKNR